MPQCKDCGEELDLDIPTYRKLDNGIYQCVSCHANQRLREDEEAALCVLAYSCCDEHVSTS